MKQWIKGANAAVLSAAVVGIFILLTFFLSSLKGVQWDLTANKKFTLSDQTLTTLKNLQQDVHVIAFTDPGAGVANRQVTDLLEEYKKRTGKLTWEEVDPKKKPSVAQKYQIDQYGTIVFESGGKTKNVYSSDLFAAGASQGSYAFQGEEKFTGAILSLTSGEKKTAYLLTGHGELTLSQASQFRRSLENENLELKELNLLKEAAIPEGAETLFVLSPQKDISEKEAELVLAFLKGKGKLLMTLDIAKDMESWKHWSSIMEAVGVKNQKALVLESRKTLSTDPLTIIPTYGYHDITKKLDEQDRITVLPGAMALTRSENTSSDFSASSLLRTSDQTYAKTNLSLFTSGTRLKMDDIKQADADLKGPLDLAYAVTDKESKPKAVVIGNGVLLQDGLIEEQGNLDFALNSVGWLQEQKDLVTIRPREEAQLQQAYISAEKGKLIFFGTVVAFPLLFLVTGGVIWWRRRKG